MLRRREGAGSGKGETERGASQTRNGTRQRERGWAVWDGRCSFVRRSGSGGAESVQEKAGGSIQPLESSRDYTSQPRVPASPRAYAHAKRACRITSAPTPARAFFPAGERGDAVRTDHPARRGDAAWKENQGPGTWALSAVLNFMGCDLVLVGAAGTPVSLLSLEYLGDYDARCREALCER